MEKDDLLITRAKNISKVEIPHDGSKQERMSRFMKIHSDKNNGATSMKAKNNSDLPAMPVNTNDDTHFYGGRDCYANGLTKREMIAMHMMASMSSTYWENIDEFSDGKHLIKCQSESAVEMADALLLELAKEQQA